MDETIGRVGYRSYYDSSRLYNWYGDVKYTKEPLMVLNLNTYIRLASSYFHKVYVQC